MISIHPQYLKDTDGNKTLVVLPLSEFNAILEELEDQEDVHLYDEAKKEDDGQRTSLSNYLKMRKERNGQI
jgi:hypothetical protein